MPERDYAGEALAQGDWVGYAIEYSASQYVKEQPGDRCLRCQHTRGVHAPDCRLDCDCKEFV